MGSIGANRESNSAVTYQETPEIRANAVKTVNGFKSGPRYQEATITRPSDGHEVRVSLEKVTTRDYWGKSTGEKTYTVYAWDTTKKDEYGNNTRLWYNYGVEGITRAKDELRRVLGIERR